MNGFDLCIEGDRKLALKGFILLRIMIKFVFCTDNCGFVVEASQCIDDQ